MTGEERERNQKVDDGMTSIVLNSIIKWTMGVDFLKCPVAAKLGLKST